ETSHHLVLPSPRSLLLSHIVSPCGEKEARRRRIAHGQRIARGTGEEQVALSKVELLHSTTFNWV
ncbi:hypothetical protein BHM03_00021641, partial [Ensete ventricosum]